MITIFISNNGAKGEQMMSPLALLSEGETGEIVDWDVQVPPAHQHPHRHRHGHGHAHRHGHGGCCGRCETCACHGAGQRSSHHLINMGLRPGKKVEMLTNSGAGPVVLRVDECRVAMGRGAAMKIYVRRIEK